MPRREILTSPERVILLPLCSGLTPELSRAPKGRRWARVAAETAGRYAGIAGGGSAGVAGQSVGASLPALAARFTAAQGSSPPNEES